MDYLKRILLTGLLLLCASGAQAQPTTAEVKALYIYKMASFLTFSGQKASPARFCYIEKSGIPKSNSVGQILAEYLDEKSRFNVMTAEHVRNIRDTAACHILFLGADQEPNIADILSRVASTNLTLSDIHRFTQRGGIIGFTVDADNRVKMEVNMTNLQASDVRVSAMLLEMMKVYK